MSKKSKKITRDDIIKDYINCNNDYFRTTKKMTIPRAIYRLRSKIPENLVRKYFGGLTALRKAADEKQALYSRFTSEITDKGGKKQRYIVTSIVEGAPINRDFYSALKLYCEKNNAKLLMLWMRGVLKTDMFSKDDMAEYKKYLFTEFKFNNTLRAKDFLLYPAQQLPLTGLDRFGSKKTSLIVASTKQMMTSIPRPKGETPHVIWTTGTVSTPEYSKTRNGALASQDNTLGALIVEVESDKKFYIRNVEWIDDCFVDLGKAYYSNKVKNIACEALVWGDLHSQEIDKISLEKAIEQTNYLKAQRIFIHDLISFNSISHHNEGKYLTKTFIPHEVNTLRKELDTAKQLLHYIHKSIKSDIIVVQSNHDDFLYRYCDEGRFLKDAHNAILGAECFIKYTKKLNPIEDYMNMKYITFLKPDESYKVLGIETGQHGHHGANGAIGSPNGFRKSYDKIVLGHSHQPKIVNNVYYVGTLSKLILAYNKGSSSWLPANCAIYKNGSRQLLIWIDNKWKM